jgi:mannose-6-phosphate isomerase-like protein (cupin superfamily)
MGYVNTKSKAAVREYLTHKSYDLLLPEHGCRKGCKAGISEHRSLTFPDPLAHEDQEGFYVISGTGWGLIDAEKHRMQPGTALIVPPGVPHAFIRDEGVPFLELFWFHAAV